MQEAEGGAINVQRVGPGKTGARQGERILERGVRGQNTARRHQPVGRTPAGVGGSDRADRPVRKQLRRRSVGTPWPEFTGLREPPLHAGNDLDGAAAVTKPPARARSAESGPTVPAASSLIMVRRPSRLSRASSGFWPGLRRSLVRNRLTHRLQSNLRGWQLDRHTRCRKTDPSRAPMIGFWTRASLVAGISLRSRSRCRGGGWAGSWFLLRLVP